jgi:hypothetical protein
LIVPEVPITVRARSSGMPQASSAPSMSATQAATSSLVGGSVWRWRSCSRTDPMSIETARRSSPWPSTSSVDPPPMSTTSTGSGGIGSCPAIAPA